MGEGGQARDLGPGGVADGVQDGGGGGDEDVFAQTLGAEGAFGIRHFDQQRGDGGDVGGGGDEVVMQVFGPAGDVFLHQGEADALGDAAFDLACGEEGVDRAAKVVGGGDAVQGYRAERGVHRQFHHLRAIAVDGVGTALAIGVERGGGGVVGRFGRQGVAARVGGQGGEVDPPGRACIGDGEGGAIEGEGGDLGSTGGTIIESIRAFKQMFGDSPEIDEDTEALLRRLTKQGNIPGITKASW